MHFPDDEADRANRKYPGTEQRKYENFWTYSVHGLPNTAPDGFTIPVAAGRSTGGPFRYDKASGFWQGIGIAVDQYPGLDNQGCVLSA
jgi:hypothetical protein